MQKRASFDIERFRQNRRYRLANRWLREFPRLLVITLFLVCLVLGVWGYIILSRAPDFHDEWGGSWLNIAYFTLQLFLGDSGPVSFGETQMGDLPWQLDVARLLAPAATVLGALIAFLVIFDEHLKRTIQRNQHGHVVVVGNTPDAEIIEEALIEKRLNVVRAPSGSKADLMSVGARGASAVYICNDDSEDPGANLRVAATVKKIPPRMPTRDTAVALYDPNLAPALLARHVTQVEPYFDLFSLTNLAASRLAAEAMAKTEAIDEDSAHRIWLLGSGRMRDEVLYELVPEWALLHNGNDRLEIEVSGAGAEDAIERTTMRLPASLLKHVKITNVADIANLEAPDLTIICGKDDAETLGIALSTPETWQGKPGSLIVHVARGDQAEALFGAEGVGMLDDAGSVLNVISTASLLRSHGGRVLVHESVADRLNYVAHRTHTRLGYGNPVEPAAAPEGRNALMRGLRSVIRARGRVTPAGLHPLLMSLEHSGWRVVPFSASVGLELPAGAVQYLAECYYNDVSGRMVPLDNEGFNRSVTPSLNSTAVPFAQLPPSESERYLELVASLPETLAQMGLGIAQIQQGNQIPLISGATPPVKRGGVQPTEAENAPSEDPELKTSATLYQPEPHLKTGATPPLKRAKTPI